MKSRHITDIQGVLGVFGHLATDKSRSNSPMGFFTSTAATEERTSEPSESGGRDSHVPMDVKFEEEPYEDEDWFLMLLSELIFNKLRLEKPPIKRLATFVSFKSDSDRPSGSPRS